jgi:hypothetical protein
MPFGTLRGTSTPDCAHDRARSIPIPSSNTKICSGGWDEQMKRMERHVARLNRAAQEPLAEARVASNYRLPGSLTARYVSRLASTILRP